MSTKNETYILNLIAKALMNQPRSIGYEKLSLSSSAQNLTSVPTNATYAVCRLESSVTTGVVARFRRDGAAATSTDGVALQHLELFDISEKQNISNLSIIQTTAGTHVLHVEYFQ